MANVLSSEGMRMLNHYLDPDPAINPAFREAVKVNPVQAAHDAGFNLTGPEIAALMKANATWNANNVSVAHRVIIAEGKKAAQPYALFW